MRGKIQRPRWLPLAVLGAVVALGSVPASAQDHDVEILDFEFDPASLLNVAPGDTVVWKNEGDSPHTVTFEDGVDSNPDCEQQGVLGPWVNCMEPEETFSRAFDEPGEYGYRCKIHPTQMVGVVVVEGDDETSSSSTTTTTTEKASTSSSTTSTSSTTTSSTSTTTTTMRELATSSSMAAPRATSSTVATAPPSTRPPAEAPVFDPPDGVDGAGGEASGNGSDGDGSGNVAMIVAVLLAVAGAGGFLLWRLRPGSGGGS